jgi:aminopeptidase N
VKALDRTSWRDLVRVGAIDGLARLRDERAVPLIDRYADPEHVISTRRAAVAALAEFGENKRAIRERLEDLLDPNDPYFTPEVLRSLTKLKDPAALSAVGKTFARSLDGRVRRQCREAMRDLRKRETPDELKRISDAFDRLRDEHQALRDELARVKAVAMPEEPSGGKRGAKHARKTAARAGAGRASGAARKPSGTSAKGSTRRRSRS